ncbi:MAG: NADH-quinone oxidoreductase subunit D [Caldisphaera sp.]|jgi:NADH-quinone oxidoreductase subunit D
MEASSSGKEIPHLPGMEISELSKNTYEVYIGPAHPGSGHMRIIVEVDGDIMVRVDPDIGFVHRTMEKLAEGRDWIKNIPLFERMAILDACNITLPYVEAVEKLLGTEPPERARYLRTLLCEINRIASHLYGTGIFGVFLGHSTLYMWAFGDREVFVDLAEQMSGARLTHSYPVFGGVRRDIPDDFPEGARKATRYMRNRLNEYAKIFLNNPNIRSRLENVGVMSKNLATELGIVGPNLRASGVRYDVRLNDPYEAYGDLEFEIPVFEEGDSLARAWARIEEMRQSLNIIDKVVDWLEKHPRENFMHEKFWKTAPKLYKDVYTGQIEYAGKYRIKLMPLFASLKVPPGKAFARVEAGRGEMVYYVESDGKDVPYRVRVVSPSFRNVIAFKYLMPGHRLMDLPTIYGSFDYFPPEWDR